MYASLRSTAGSYVPDAPSSAVTHRSEIKARLSELRTADRFRKADCYIALGATLWTGEQVEVNGARLDVRACYLKALSLDSNHATAFYALGTTLNPGKQIEVHGARLDERACYLKALSLDPNYACAFHDLGTTLNPGEQIEVNGARLDERAFYVKALSLDPNYEVALHNLGLTLRPGEQIKVNGARLDKKSCYLKALNLNPENASAFNNLGSTLSPGERIEVNGARLDQKACYVKALSLDPKNASAFHNLGTTLSPGERIEVNGARLDQKACYVKALSLDPNHAAAFTNLGTTLSPGERIEVYGARLDKKACYVKALSLDPNHAAAFTNLGTTLSPGERIEVYGAHLDKKACYLKALECGGLSDEDVETIRQQLIVLDAEHERTLAALDNATLPPYESRMAPLPPSLANISLSEQVAHKLQLFLSQCPEDATTVGHLLAHALTLSDIAGSEKIHKLMADPFDPKSANGRAYYTAFNQAMERMYVTAQVGISGAIKLETPKVMMAMDSTDDKVGAMLEATMKGAGALLPVPILPTILSGITCLIWHRKIVDLENDMQKIVACFDNTDHLKSMARGLAQAICIEKKDALEQYTESDASSRDKLKNFDRENNLTKISLVRATSGPGPTSTLMSKLTAKLTQVGKDLKLAPENSLFDTPMQRKAVMDVRQLVDPMLDPAHAQELKTIQANYFADQDALLLWAKKQFDLGKVQETVPTSRRGPSKTPQSVAQGSGHVAGGQCPCRTVAVATRKTTR